MEATEIEGAHGLPRDTTSISDELQHVLHDLGRQYPNKTIKSCYVLRYTRRVIALLIKEEENAEGHKRNTATGKMKVSGLSHKRAKQSDPRLLLEMFHIIYHIYSDTKNKEETN